MISERMMMRRRLVGHCCIYFGNCCVIPSRMFLFYAPDIFNNEGG